MMKKLSVIVTVYNKKKYIQECINSIIEQTVVDKEIIIVDDGSTDGSSILCDNMAKKYKNLIVLHQSNKGALAARKLGVKKAAGDYILFVDSDDYLEKNILKDLFDEMEHDIDVLACDWVKHDGNHTIVDAGLIPEGIYREGINKSYFAANMIFSGGLKNGINGSLCTKIIRKKILEEIYSVIPDGIVYAEDDFTAYACMAKAKSVKISHNIIYHYNMNYDSISHNRIGTFLSDLERGYKAYLTVISNLPDYKKYKAQIEIYIQRAIYMGIDKYMGFEMKAKIPYYKCDVTEIPRGSNIIIYGAGKVGKSYFRQLIKDENYTLRAWVDKEYQTYRNLGYNVESPEVLRQKDFDYIIIALANKKSSDEISTCLEEEYSIDTKHIYWKEPINFIEKMLLENTGE